MAQKAIGPNFVNELAAAGLWPLPFWWDVAGNFYNLAALSAAQQTAVSGVYAAHDPSKPDFKAAAATLQANGLTVTSSSTPALNGVYAIGQQDEINIVSLQVAVQNGIFPGWLRDKAGTKHTMTAAQFTTLATAVLQFVAALDDALATALAGGAWAPPGNSVTIA